MIFERALRKLFGLSDLQFSSCNMEVIPPFFQLLSFSLLKSSHLLCVTGFLQLQWPMSWQAMGWYFSC